MKSRSPVLSITLILGTFAAGVATRFAHLGLPQLFVKYGGSCFWAMLLYWVVSTIMPRLHPAPAALTSAAIATAIEFFKLLHTPTLDAFRLTLLGILLLGRIFSVRDLIAYALAIATATFIDHIVRKHENGPPANPESRSSF